MTVVTLSVYRVHGIAASVDDVDNNNVGSDDEGVSFPLVASYKRFFTIEKSTGQRPVPRKEDRTLNPKP